MHAPVSTSAKTSGDETYTMAAVARASPASSNTIVRASVRTCADEREIAASCESEWKPAIMIRCTPQADEEAVNKSSEMRKRHGITQESRKNSVKTCCGA